MTGIGDIELQKQLSHEFSWSPEISDDGGSRRPGLTH
jgi:hypothetical protein